MRPLLVLTYWSFKDALLQTYLPQIQALAAIHGGPVYLVTMEQAHIRAEAKERASIAAALGKDGIIPIFLTYRRFGLAAMAMWGWYFVRLLSLIAIKRVGAIHAVCMAPGAAGYILSILSGRPLVVDSYEPHAEAMVENGTWARTSRAFRLLFSLEKRQSRRAVALIGVTRSMQTYARERYGVKNTPFFVKPLCFDLNKVPRTEEPQRLAIRVRLGLDHKTVAIYAGKFGGIYYQKETFRLFRAAQDVWGDRFHLILLTPNPAPDVSQELASHGVDARNVTIRYVSHAEALEMMRAADFGINPVNPVPTKRHCTSIKDGEYWAAGLPVIIPPGISDDSDIIARNGTGVIWSDVSEDGCRKAILEMQQLLTRDRIELAGKARQQAEEFRSLTIAADAYRAVYVTLLARPRSK